MDSGQHNQLLFDLIDQIDDLLDAGQIDLQKSIEVKEQLYYLEEIHDLIDWSSLVTIESRLFNSSTLFEFTRMTDELNEFVHREQFRLSKANDLIQTWQWNGETGNAQEKQILKAFDDLALLNRLYGPSSDRLSTRAMLDLPFRSLIFSIPESIHRAETDEFNCSTTTSARFTTSEKSGRERSASRRLHSFSRSNSVEVRFKPMPNRILDQTTGNPLEADLSDIITAYGTTVPCRDSQTLA